MNEEVKVTIEWNANTAGLHPDPMRVQFSGEANLNEIIGAVGKAMGVIKSEKNKKDAVMMNFCI